MASPNADLLSRYGSDTPLADIPWQELPSCLQEICRQFIQSWWNGLNLDQPIEASGMADMTLAEVLALQEREEEALVSKCYRLVSYLRVDPEDAEPMTYEEVLNEQQQQELMSPENLYRIEEVETEGQRV